jgi:hypothetical protein
MPFIAPTTTKDPPEFLCRQRLSAASEQDVAFGVRGAPGSRGALGTRRAGGRYFFV